MISMFKPKIQKKNYNHKREGQHQPIENMHPSQNNLTQSNNQNIMNRKNNQ